MSIPPPYNAKVNQPMSDEYDQQVRYPNPPIQQGQVLPNGNGMMLGADSYPIACRCPNCHQSIVTKVEKDTGLAVWLSATVLCVFGCFCGCCLIPFCIDDMKDTIHYCPNCNRIIAENRRL